ncbi:hypothetical protein LEP1GSC013_1192 [Leptospira interrogans serovar Valbuzzi str. Duyster]|nr:hypothetical protein LEP1GSC013_1192 [Leptospira interrogans serovar Valbuzzi str. Duyster]ENO72634.1 hypothetical protein LEP1GSC012_2785 [Leptospira interrogans serovar Valbuzzi str. Valbuzzi]
MLSLNATWKIKRVLSKDRRHSGSVLLSSRSETLNFSNALFRN